MNGLRSSPVNFCRANGGGFVGNGCVGQVSSPGMSDLGNGALFNRPQRLSRHAVEDAHEALFADLGHRIHRSPVVLHA